MQDRTNGGGRRDDDLSALAWVHGELRRSLEQAHKALRRYLKEAEAAAGSDVDAVDPAVLRSARSQLHQGVGALELVGLPAVADVLRAAEAAVQRLVARPAMADLAAVETIERVSFALLDFLGRQLAGKAVSPLMLFPQYRAAQQLAAADRIHPADLWKIDWQWLDLQADASAQPRRADDAARGAMETLVLALMRDPSRGALARMSDLCADLGAGARGPSRPDTPPGGSSTRLATFWQLAAAVFEAQACGLLAGDVYTKRLASRLLAQLRISVRGQHELSDRLAQDLLFFCAHARPPHPGHLAPRLAAVRAAWRLDQRPTADYESARLGRFDPAQLSLAKKRVAAAKDAWSAVAGGELHRSTGLAEQFALVGDSLQRLVPAGETLARAFATAVAQTVAAGDAPPAALAMEVATAMLYLDASLEDGELDHPELADRIQHLARRIDDVRIGAEPQPLEVWMEELYRRVSDRQTMGSVVQELRASLSEVEKQIDQYFRNPVLRELLIPVPAQLSAMRGVFSVLGLEHASHAVVHMRDAVDALAQTEVEPQRAIQAGTFDRLADNLGALSFLIDMLAVQPALAKSLFRFDTAAGSLSAVMGQPERISAFADLEPAAPAPAPAAESGLPPLLAQAEALAAAAARPDIGDDELAGRIEQLSQQALAAEQPQLARLLGGARLALLRAGDAAGRHAVRAELADALGSHAPAAPEALPPPGPVPPPAPVAPGASGLEDNAEVREIFIEEAREVIAAAQEALERLADAPDRSDEMTTVRRAFHTLKGSARMVGLPEYGEAAWACEQLYNARLAQAPRMDQPLRLFSAEALAYLAHWADAIAEGRSGGHNAPAVARAADALRLDGVRLGIEVPRSAAEAAAPEPAAPLPAAPEAVVDRPAADAAAIPETAAPAAAPPVEPVEHAPAMAEAPDAAAEAAQAEPLPAAAESPPAAAEPLPASFEPSPVTAPEAEPAPFDLDAPAESVEAVPAPPLPPLDFDIDLPEPAETAPSWEATVALPAAPAAPAPVLDFEFDLGSGGATPAQPAAAETLAQRVPDLPSAADLDLGLPDLDALVPPASAPPAPAAEPEFILDLPLAAPPPEPALDERPPLQVEALEIDFDAAEALFAPEAGGPAAPPAALDLDVGALEASVTREEAPTEILPVGEVVGEGSADRPPPPLAGAIDDADEQVKIIGPLRIGIPLFNIYLNEADELSRRLGTELAEWSLEYERHPVPDSSVALAHSLAGSSATVGYAELSALARALEHALMRSHAAGHGQTGEPALFNDAADEIRRLLHQFAAGFLRPVAPDLMERLAAHERPEPKPAPVPAPAIDIDLQPLAGAAFEPAEAPGPVEPPEPVPALSDAAPVEAPAAAMPVPETIEQTTPEPVGEITEAGAAAEAIEPTEAAEAAEPASAWASLPAVAVSAFMPPEAPATLGTGASADAFDDDADIDAVDAVDAELFPIFQEEADELLPQLQARLRDWVERPASMDAPAACMRTLHTFKGGARLAGAMRLGEMAHRLETAVEHLAAGAAVASADVEPLLARADAMAAAFDALRDAARREAAGTVPAAAPAAVATAAPVPEPSRAPEREPEPAPEPPPPAAAAAAPAIDWSRFAAADTGAPAAAEDPPAAVVAAVRVRAALLDRLVNQAGEVSITRARIDADVRQMQGWLAELSDSLDRMRRQLRDIELQAETQIGSRIEAARASAQAFDPLEMDRYTRFQELTRFMAESVNDVATLQRSLQRTLQSAEDELAAQTRLTRELQDDLLRTRMVEFESMADRLYRTVRQAAKDAGRQVRLDIEGGAIEIDRGVLERMTGPFEHLLRNAVAHGIEPPAARVRAGKEAGGRITIAVAQAGNEVAVEFADDGAGLDLQRIRERAVERALIAPGQALADAELAQLIFASGFSTADSVTELAGRGVGLDVVRAEVNAMGGRIETASDPGRGTRFRLLLPLTTAVTQVVMLRCGELQVAVPSTLIEVVRRVPSAEAERAYAEGTLDYLGEPLPFFWLAALLDAGTRGSTEGRAQAVIVIRSAAQRVAVHVDEVVGNQEVVVKNVGPQLARLPGLAGVTLLPSGAVALIYNPVALASVHAEAARQRMRAGIPVPGPEVAAAPPRTPLVMVVDDSLTVRRVTQRLLLREGWRVVTAKDGMEALERLAEERPAVLLSDIEMPRMDGFDLVRNVRADPRLADLPVVMITSRIAQKHRDYAAELGVQHYLGKPYSEEELLSLVAHHAGAALPDILT